MDITSCALFQIRLLVKWQQFKINTQMLVWEMWREVMLSMSSWVSVWHGQWPPSITEWMAMFSALRRESKFAWISLLHIYIKFIFPLFSLAFSVTLFCSEACIAILILLIRRNKRIGGELGGPRVAKYITATALIGLWLIYLIASSLEAYGVIKVGKNA